MIWILKFAGNVSLTELSFLRVDPMDDFPLFGSCEWHVFFFFRGGEGGKERGPFWRHISSRRRRDWARSTSFVVCRYLFMYEIFETVKLVEICSLETYTFPFNLRLISHWQSTCTDTNKFTTYFSIYWISNDIRTFGWGKLPHNSQISNAKKKIREKSLDCLFG